MINLLAFLLALAGFVVSVVALVSTRLDLVDGGILLVLSLALMLLSYPAILNRS
jgi:hypothetical protein